MKGTVGGDRLSGLSSQSAGSRADNPENPDRATKQR